MRTGLEAFGLEGAAIRHRLTTRTDVSVETTLELEGRGFEVVLHAVGSSPTPAVLGSAP